ncbi:2Fe-2S iron-sulfur cluster-binding protein [Microcoleus sp. S13_B4]|uniref:2Fe-2S iron-sulfur cluster-binding protein n=1 Tax=Microcoleus sp. S13_B4 TaxID=3055408 RepID=UPI002FD5357B
MPQIHYLPDDRTIEIDDDDIILEASLRADIPHTHICGGSARCSTCRVLICRRFRILLSAHFAGRGTREKIAFRTGN